MNIEFNLIAKRPDGIFYKCYIDGGYFSDMLTHSFNGEPLVPDGEYILVRGRHCLEGGKPFETFEIRAQSGDVPIDGHSGILIHPGNFNSDSKGCYLPGSVIKSKVWSVEHSRDYFAEFLHATAGEDEIPLIIGD